MRSVDFRVYGVYVNHLSGIEKLRSSMTIKDAVSKMRSLCEREAFKKLDERSQDQEPEVSANEAVRAVQAG